MSSLKNKYVLGIDIGGTNFRLGLVTKEGELHDFVIQRSNILVSENNSVENLIKAINEYLVNKLDGDLLAISLGFPSTISKDKKIVYSTPNLKGFDNVNIVDPLQETFKVPIFLNKDVNSLLQYDIVQKHLEGNKVILGFYIGTGFGNSIYIDDNFLAGKNGVAGEVGHIPVLNSKELCGCNNEGCIEIYASGKRLNQIREEFFKDTDITEIFTKHKDTPIIEEFIEALSIPVATERNILDPDYIFIGGGILQMADFPFEKFEKYIYKHTRKPYPAETFNIIYSNEDQTAGVLGSTYYAFKKLSKSKN